jgi:hypothetical protein
MILKGKNIFILLDNVASHDIHGLFYVGYFKAIKLIKVCGNV